MKKFTWMMIVGLLFVAVDAHANLTADQIVQKQIDMNKGFVDERADGKMVIVGKTGKQTLREFDFFQLEEKGNESYKAMIKINKPNDLKGTGLLTYQNKGGSDDQWLYLPALKKTRRISGSSKSGRFLGSDFSFEDLAPKDQDDFNNTLLRSEACGEVQCYVIESQSKTGDSQYSKSVSWIRHDNFQAVKMELYDGKGQLYKVASFASYQQVGGKYWRPYQITMKDVQKNRHTQLVFSDLKIGVGLSAGQFSKKALER